MTPAPIFFGSMHPSSFWKNENGIFSFTSGVSQSHPTLPDNTRLYLIYPHFICQHSNKAARTYQPARHSVHHDPLWQIHGVCNSKDDQLWVLLGWPVKQIVHYILLPGPQKVELEEKGRKQKLTGEEWWACCYSAYLGLKTSATM